MDKEDSQQYQKNMIEAFINKPEKTLWYQHAFSKFNINGIDSMKWHWNWWAFFGGFFFLLYRKQYLPATLLFIVSITIGMVFPLGFIISILAGGYSTYFVYNGYKRKLAEIESNIDDIDIRVQTMREVAGYHQWVIWLYIALALFFFSSFTFVLFGTIHY